MDVIISQLTDDQYRAVCTRLAHCRSSIHQRRLVYQIDSTMLPVRAWSDDLHDVTPVWVTLSVDVASRLIVGYDVHFGTPTTGDTLRALLRTLLPGPGLTMVGFGLPWIVQSDNGSCFGGLFTQTLAALRIFASKTAPGKPYQNAYVERTNRSVKHLMDFDVAEETTTRLPGTPRPTDYEVSVGVYHRSDIIRAVCSALTHYQLRHHRAIKTSPLQCWQRRWDYEVERPFDQQAILTAFRVETPRRVTDGRMQLLDGTVIEDPRLLPYRDAELTLETAMVLDADKITVRCGKSIVLTRLISKPTPWVDTAVGTIIQAASEPKEIIGADQVTASVEHYPRRVMHTSPNQLRPIFKNPRKTVLA